MSDDNTSGDPGNTGESQNSQSQGNGVDPEKAKLEAQVEVLQKQLNDKESFIGKQSTEIGTLRAQVEATKGQAGEGQKVTQGNENPTDQNQKPNENEPFEFKNLPVEMQDRVKLFLKKQTEGLSDEDKAKYAEALTPSRFNELAKRVLKEIDVDTEHIHHVNDILGIADPLSVPNAGDEVMQDILTQFNLAKRQLTKTPPGGGSVQGSQGLKLESKPKVQQRV